MDPAPPKQTEKAASPQPLHARCRNPETLAFQVMRGIVFPALVLASYLYCMVFSCTIASPATGGFYHIFQIISAVQYRGFTLFTILIPITVLYAVQNRLARRTCGETGFMAEKKQYPLRIHLLRKLPFLCLLLMGWLAYSFLQDAASPFNILMACLSIFSIYCMLTDIISNILAISKWKKKRFPKADGESESSQEDAHRPDWKNWWKMALELGGKEN